MFLGDDPPSSPSPNCYRAIWLAIQLKGKLQRYEILGEKKRQDFIKSKHDTFSVMVCCFPESPDGANADHPVSDVSQRVGASTSPKPTSVCKQKRTTSENFLWGK